MSLQHAKRVELDERPILADHAPAFGGNGVVPIHGHEAAKTHVAEDSPWSAPAADSRAVTPRRSQNRAVILDVAMLAAANLLFLAADTGQSFLWPLLLVFDAVVIGLTVNWRGYAPRFRLDALDDFRRAATTTAIATMAVLSLNTLLPADEPNAYAILQLWVVATLLLVVGRATSNLASSRRRLNGKLGATTIIVGAGEVGRLTASRLLEHPELGLHPIGFVDSDPFANSCKPLPLPVLGTNSSLAHIIGARDVEFVVVAFSSASHDEFIWLLDECDRLGIRALIVPRLFERVPARLQVTHVGGLPLLEMLPTSPRSVQFLVKYVFDRLVALGLLIVLAPLVATIAAVVAISLGRPLLYRQDRVSLDGRHFRMLKFRTMQTPSNENEDSPQFDPERAPGGVEGADRRTRAGTFLRRWSLDELPQLVNVLKGEMSMVGPRPERPEYVEYFREHVRRYDGRLRTKAGITGWAQIHRLRGNTSIADRVEWDNYYIENFSLWLDLKILLLTLPEALKGRAD